MYRYILTFIIINSGYVSFGYPAQDSVNHVPLGNKLQSLADSCENAVISDLIKSQIVRCNASSTVDIDLEPKCLMFFDINKQLCEAFDKSKYDIQSDYSSKMQESQNVQNLCQHAGSWNLKYLKDYPELNLEKVFKTDILCVKMCANNEVLLSVDANFFCKYYMWGSEAVKKAKPTIPQTSNENIDTKNIEPVIINKDIINGADNLPDVNKIDVSSSNKNDNATKESLAGSSKVDITKTNSVNVDATTAITQGSTSAAQKQVEKDNPIKIEPPVAPIVSEVKNEIEKPLVMSGEKEMKKNSEPQDSEAVIDNPKDDTIIEDDQEDDEEDDHQYDQDGSIPKALGKSDSEAKHIGNNNDLTNVNQNNHNKAEPENENDEKRKKSRIEIENDTTFKIYSGPQIVAEIFPNSMQDSLSDDDDHFFPLFLTAIVLVILLYIVYHNKNKFTKVILGLIVEGRQSGKRRNSRGHSYRRLDTLEQAMSTNTAAPPSKIIY